MMVPVRLTAYEFSGDAGGSVDRPDSGEPNHRRRDRHGGVRCNEGLGGTGFDAALSGAEEGYDAPKARTAYRARLRKERTEQTLGCRSQDADRHTRELNMPARIANACRKPLLPVRWSVGATAPRQIERAHHVTSALEGKAILNHGDLVALVPCRLTAYEFSGDAGGSVDRPNSGEPKATEGEIATAASAATRG